MAKLRGMNERIQKLREVSVTTPVHIDLERAKIETDFYKENDGKYSIPVMRAMVLKEYFSRKTLYLGEGELIIGEKGRDPQASPTFPELCCHSVEDMTVMSERELVSFHTTEEDRKLQAEEIIPYWTGRSMREKILERMTPEWHECYSAGMFTEFMEQRGPGHTCGGEQVFTTGYLDYKAKIKETMDALDYINDPDAVNKCEELKAMDISCDAVIILGERYRELALTMAGKEADETRKAELMQIAANLEVVPAHKPQTFWQAIQLYWFTHLAVTTELNPWDAFSPGRLDQHLNPYYEKDVEAGILDDDKALEQYRKRHKGSFTLQRYKGLGEMDAEQLWETTLDPKTRILKRVEIEDGKMASDVTSVLMGNDVPPRREFIYNHAREAEIDA